jgi:hypothetical protein
MLTFLDGLSRGRLMDRHKLPAHGYSFVFYEISAAPTPLQPCRDARCSMSGNLKPLLGSARRSLLLASRVPFYRSFNHADNSGLVEPINCAILPDCGNSQMNKPQLLLLRNLGDDFSKRFVAIAHF